VALDLVVCLLRQLLLRLNHTEVDILLMRGSNLLLLLLKEFDLLCEGKLLHCKSVSRKWYEVSIQADLLMRGVISDGLLL